LNPNINYLRLVLLLASFALVGNQKLWSLNVFWRDHTAGNGGAGIQTWVLSARKIKLRQE
jgi:hypothetical protein